MRIIYMQVCKNLSIFLHIIIIIITICYIYIVLFWVLKALYIVRGEISSSTTSVQHPPGWCDGSHVPELQPHTSLLVERRQSDEANQCMGMIRRPWLSEANEAIWPGCQGFLPYSFSKDILGFWMTTKSQDLDLTSHLKDGACWQYSVSVTTLGC